MYKTTLHEVIQQTESNGAVTECIFQPLSSKPEQCSLSDPPLPCAPKAAAPAPCAGGWMTAAVLQSGKCIAYICYGAAPIVK